MSPTPARALPDAARLPIRGYLLDVSRNRIPTTAELERLVDLLASLDYNQLQLYVEHTFAYEGHETVWRGWDPLRPSELRHLAAYAAERGVELVPNQNSFGHFHRWLVHEPYRALAECPDGVDHPFSPEPEPFSLCPTDPGSLELLADLYAQLLPCFDARPAESEGRPPYLNTGLDETLDLGRGRSQALCEEHGTSAVYLDFLRRVHALVAEHGRRMLFWGDVLLEAPESIAGLPDDVVALLWGYEAHHPFDRDARRLADAGLEFWLCPGTSSWNSFGGRIRNMLQNLRRAADAAVRHGAGGLLLTDWGDHGHLQPPPISWPGLVAAAASWNGEGHLERDELADALLRHIPEIEERRVAEALVSLGEIEELTGAGARNGSALFFAVLHAGKPPEDRRGEGMTRAGLERAADRLDEIGARLSPDTLVERELRWVADALRLGVAISRARLALGVDLPIAELPRDVRRRLAADRDRLLAGLDPIWLARSRRGGLEASKRRLRQALAIDATMARSEHGSRTPSRESPSPERER